MQLKAFITNFIGPEQFQKAAVAVFDLIRNPVTQSEKRPPMSLKAFASCV